MENRLYPQDQTPLERLTLHIDPIILDDLRLAGHLQTNLTNSPLLQSSCALLKKNDRLWVNYPDGEYCDYPYYLKNILWILNDLQAAKTDQQLPSEPFDSLIKTNQTIEKKIFSSAPMTQWQNMKDLWAEVIKKINFITSNCHSLGSLVERLLEVTFLQNFQSSLIILHLKGQTKAGVLGTVWRSERTQGLIEVKDFNSFFNSVKKSKIKSFSTEIFPRINLPFNGSFLAKEVASKKYSMIAIASRHDFLSYDQEEIRLYETCIDLLQPHFERLVDQEFSDKRISELRMCLKDFPLPLRVKELATGAAFYNDLYHEGLQDKDIFFSKKVKGPYGLDLYDSDELRHYAFDLFHFQRISLLGELLNTLRHELSNPLFGLKLGSQIFRTIETTDEDRSFMLEIEKNINRCQIIIENFSNLYQTQTEKRPVQVKKMIEEALILSKSEVREVRKSIRYLDQTEEMVLDLPLIFVVQIIFNLIVNASQAMKQLGPPGELTILVKSEDSSIYVDIKDNGPGIPEDQVVNLFKPFFTTKPHGTGLGLVLSRNLALKMGGNLEYLVNNEHKGAHFRLTLPIS